MLLAFTIMSAFRDRRRYTAWSYHFGIFIGLDNVLSGCVREKGRDVSDVLRRAAVRGSAKGRSRTRSAGRRARIADVMIRVSLLVKM